MMRSKKSRRWAIRAERRADAARSDHEDVQRLPSVTPRLTQCVQMWYECLALRVTRPGHYSNAQSAARGPVVPLRTLDDVDRALIEALQQNGRDSFRRIATEVGVSEATIRSRTSVCEEGTVQVTAVTNPLGLGFDAMAMVGVRTSGPPEGPAAEQIAQLDEADYVVVAAGQFDLLVELVCIDRRHLLDVTNTIWAMTRRLDRDLRLSQSCTSSCTTGASGTQSTSRPLRRGQKEADGNRRAHRSRTERSPLGAARTRGSRPARSASSRASSSASRRRRRATAWRRRSASSRVIAGIGYQAPIVIALAFIPTYLIALAFKYMNRPIPTAARHSPGRPAHSGRTRAGSAAGG